MFSRPFVYVTEIRRFGIAAAVALALNLGGATSVTATELDCTTGCNASYAGALWMTVDTQATGTGVIDSFVRIQANGTPVEGHNTGGTLLNDELNGHSFDRQLGDVPIIKINGVLYYEFLLDINQTSNNPLLILNNVQICLSPTASLSSAGSCPTSPSYQMGTYGGGDGTGILLDYNLNSGSGSGDLFMYIPVTALGTNMTDYVYLFSQFGALTGYENNDGFEEWAVRVCGETYGKTKDSPGTVLQCDQPPVIPEPGTLVLFGTGLVGLAVIARRRRR